MIETDMFSAIFCAIILIYACYSDLKTRSVTNKLWLLMIAVGIPIAVYNIFIYGIPYLICFITSVSFTFVLSYLFFRFYIFGGADAKSLICISVLIPVHPCFTFLTHHFPISFNSSLVSDPFPFAITTLLNASIVALIIPLTLFFHNLLNIRPKELRANIGLAFIGYKLRIDALTGAKHIRLVHSYEEKEGKLERRHSFGGVEIDVAVVERLKKYNTQGKQDEKVWVTPELPFIIFITVGFFISLFYGNLIFHSLSLLFMP